MENEEKYTEAAFHKTMAVRLFNATWDLLEKENRTQSDNDRMIHSAHASRLHWESVGAVKNRIIGEWQISRVYSALHLAESALYHAQRSLELCQTERMNGFLLAYSYEAMARAYSLTQDERATRYLQLALQAGEEIADATEKQRLVDDLKTVQVSGVGR